MPAVRRLVPRLVDGGMALGFAAIALGTVLTGVDDGYRGSAPVWQSAVVGATAPLPLVLRRRRPVLALALVVLLRGLPQLVADVDRPFLGAGVLVVVAFASCVQWGRRPWQATAVVFPVALFAEYAALDHRFLRPGEWLFDLAILLVGWGVGLALRLLRDRNAALERELAAVARTERLRQEARVATEREQIARELHDVIAHDVTAMLVQAGSARMQLETRPDLSAAALLTVERSGREALAELRRALGLLRADGDPELER